MRAGIPAVFPRKYDVEEYVLRFAHEANIAPDDVGKAAAATTAAALHHLPAAQLDKALGAAAPRAVGRTSTQAMTSAGVTCR